MAFWADMDWEAREEVLASVQKRFAARWEKGRTKYRSDLFGFQGDPLEHALEEAYDLVIYLEYLVRQRNQTTSNGHAKATLLDIQPEMAFIQAPDGEDCKD